MPERFTLMNPDLSLVAFDALLDELTKRVDASVFVYTKDINKDSEEAQVHLKGSRFTCAGLIDMAAMQVSEEIEQFKDKEEIS